MVHKPSNTLPKVLYIGFGQRGDTSTALIKSYSKLYSILAQPTCSKSKGAYLRRKQTRSTETGPVLDIVAREAVKGSSGDKDQQRRAKAKEANFGLVREGAGSKVSGAVSLRVRLCCRGVFQI